MNSIKNKDGETIIKVTVDEIWFTLEGIEKIIELFKQKNELIDRFTITNDPHVGLHLNISPKKN